MEEKKISQNIISATKILSVCPNLFCQDLDWSEVSESSAADDIPRHSAVPQHPQNQHKHQVSSQVIFVLVYCINVIILKFLSFCNAWMDWDWYISDLLSSSQYSSLSGWQLRASSTWSVGEYSRALNKQAPQMLWLWKQLSLRLLPRSDVWVKDIFRLNLD